MLTQYAAPPSRATLRANLARVAVRDGAPQALALEMAAHEDRARHEPTGRIHPRWCPVHCPPANNGCPWCEVRP